MSLHVQPKNIITIDEQTANALELLKEALSNLPQFRGSLSSLQNTGFTVTPASRTLKVHRDIQANSNRKIEYEIPTMRLAGKWLEAAGFSPDMTVQVITLDKLLIICPEDIPKEAGKLRSIV